MKRHLAGEFAFDQPDDVEAGRNLDQRPDLAVLELEENRLGFAGLNLAALAAVAEAFSCKAAFAVVVLGELVEVGAGADALKDVVGENARFVNGAARLLAIDEDILPFHAVVDLKLFRMAVVIVENLFVADLVDHRHDAAAK